jgi:hypothetical protein
VDSHEGCWFGMEQYHFACGNLCWAEAVFAKTVVRMPIRPVASRVVLAMLLVLSGNVTCSVSCLLVGSILPVGGDTKTPCYVDPQRWKITVTISVRQGPAAVGS